MYRHHFSQRHDEGGDEYMRTMVDSLTQQLIRQYPGYYALYVALGPDHEWRLISCPFYTLQTSKDDRPSTSRMSRLVDESCVRYCPALCNFFFTMLCSLGDKTIWGNSNPSLRLCSMPMVCIAAAQRERCQRISFPPRTYVPTIMFTSLKGALTGPED